MTPFPRKVAWVRLPAATGAGSSRGQGWPGALGSTPDPRVLNRIRGMDGVPSEVPRQCPQNEDASG